MNDVSPYLQFERAVKAHDSTAACAIATAHLEYFIETDQLQEILHEAAKRNEVDVVRLLIEKGAHLVAPVEGSNEEDVLTVAVDYGSDNVIRWCLQQGVRLNRRIRGMIRCDSMIAAVTKGRLDIVRLLVAHGADFNAVWIDMNALSYAMMYNRREIVDYLRSVGAKEPRELMAVKEPSQPQGMLAHFEKHLGKSRDLALTEVAGGTPPLAIHAIDTAESIVLFTVGMSDRPMSVPKGAEEYRYAELMIHLPKNWPLTPESLGEKRHAWPINWLRRIARHPFDHQTWLGGKTCVIANGEPPKPLAPYTKLSCLFLLAESGEFGRSTLPDGRRVVVYSIYPIFTEERDLERSKGTAHLLRLFEQNAIDTIVNVNRGNVATLSAN